MKKLKTLRDIELYHKINTDVKDDYDVLYDELKEAAKEWIKEIRLKKEKDGDNVIRDEAIIWWIKYFFNLEEK